MSHSPRSYVSAGHCGRNLYALCLGLGSMFLMLAPATAAAVDFDAEVIDIWLSPSDICVGASSDVYAKFRNLSDPGGPYGGAATFDARIIVTKPSGSSSYAYIDNWSFDYSGQEKNLYWDNYNFNQAGTYTVKAEIYDIDGYQSGWSTTHRFDYGIEYFAIVNHAPSASRDDPASASVTLAPGQNLTFRVRGDDCDGNLYKAEWYRDGEYEDYGWMSGSSDTDSWTESFPDTGVYGITAIVYDNEWEHDQVSWTVTVQNHAPSASRDDPTSASVTLAPGQSLTFRVRGDDADGNLYKAEWYRDGEYEDYGWMSGSSDTDSWTESFPDAGVYGITAVVYDELWEHDEVSWTVTVQNHAPSASRDDPTSASVTLAPGQSLTFRVRGDDADGNLYKAEWYRDGEYEDYGWMSGSSDTDSWTESFPDAGVYGITAVVYDELWEHDEVSWTVTVQNNPPTASREDPSEASVTLELASSQTFIVRGTDLDGNLDFVEWYRDGSYTGDRDEISGSSDTASHTEPFLVSGTFGITAVVFDESGANDETSWAVEVARPRRGMYVNGVYMLMYFRPVQLSLLEYVKQQNITYLAFYIDGDSEFMTPPNDTLMSDFIQLAKGVYAVEAIGLTGGATTDFDAYLAYIANHPGEIDVFNLEREFWHGEGTFEQWVSILQHMRAIGAPHNVLVEAYIGTDAVYEDVLQIPPLVDRLFVAAYALDPLTAYINTRNHLLWSGESGHQVTIWPIFSAESNYRGYEPYMGDWLTEHTLSEAEDDYLAAYAADPDERLLGVDLLGCQYFDYEMMSPLLFLSATSFTPEDEAADVPVDSNLEIEFFDFFATPWDPMTISKGTSGNISIIRPADGSILETIPVTGPRVSVVGNRVIIDPLSTLEPDTEYCCLIDPTCFECAIPAIAGSPYPGISICDGWRFTTEAGCADNSECDDGLFCNGVETCDVAGHCQSGTPIDCDDGGSCTVDSCNEGTDSCGNIPDDALCDDGLWCDGTETCDSAGDCQPGTDVDCSDGVDCTVDSCNEGADSCDNIPDDGLCNNGLWCDGTETCDPVADCQPGSEPCIDLAHCDEVDDVCICADDNDCNDGLTCTTDTCNQQGHCEYALDAGYCLIAATCYAAGDPNPANDCQECDPPTDANGWSPSSEETPCGDPGDTECDHADTCDGAGTCMDNQEPDGTSCTDGSFCNGEETCQAGVCALGAEPCDENEECDEDLDVCYVPCNTNGDCDDELFCNGEETCDAGRCVDGAFPCTAGQTCNEDTDTCEVPPPPPPPPPIPTPPHQADQAQPWDGDCTCATCEDGRIEMCEAVGYAAAFFRGDHDDGAGAMQGLELWMHGELYHWDESQHDWASDSEE